MGGVKLALYIFNDISYYNIVFVVKFLLLLVVV